MEVLVAFIALFATVFGIFYVSVTTRNKERMSLIDKGADASLFNTGKEGQRSLFNWNKLTLKIGMLFMGVGIGIIAGAILESFRVMPAGPDYVSMIFLFGGFSLVLFYLIDRKNK
jgi:F0F1-type ATP synthase membrane subunit c/vacuolar-type H+-ATPase subunit K